MRICPWNFTHEKNHKEQSLSLKLSNVFEVMEFASYDLEIYSFIHYVMIMLVIMNFLGYKIMFFKKSARAKSILNHLTTISWNYKIDLKIKKCLSNKGFKKKLYRIIGVHYNTKAQLQINWIFIIFVYFLILKPKSILYNL
jgi:hypothetical protein